MNAKSQLSVEGDLSFWLGKYVGRIETQLEHFASRLGISSSELTHRLGTLLLSSASGEQVRPEDSVPTLRRASAAGNQSVRALALAGSSSGQTQSLIGEKQRAYWQRMTPEQRKKEVARRRAINASYWAKMNPEQRKKEMARRVAKRRLGKASLATMTAERRAERRGGGGR